MNKTVLLVLLVFAVIQISFSIRNLRRGGSRSLRDAIDNATSYDYENTADVYLKANVTVTEIYIDVENITAEVNLNAVVAKDLVTLVAGVDVSIDRVTIEIDNVEAEVELVVYLDKVQRIVSRTLQTIAKNPQIITTLLDVVGTTLSNVLSTTVNELGQTVSVLISVTGQIVERIIDPTTNAVLNSTIVGNIADLPVLNQKTLSTGNIEKLVYDSATQSLISVTLNSVGTVVSSTVVQSGISLD